MDKWYFFTVDDKMFIFLISSTFLSTSASYAKWINKNLDEI